MRLFWGIFHHCDSYKRCKRSSFLLWVAKIRIVSLGLEETRDVLWNFFFCVTLKVHVILLCANTWWPEKIFCIAHFCSSTSTFFLKCHFWFPGIFKVFGKTDVDNRIIEATIKKPFLARGTLNLKTNGLNEKKWQQKTAFVVNSEWPANFNTNQLIATVLPDFNNKVRISQCLKIAKNVAFEFLCLGIFTNFCSIKIDLSGNTV